MIEPKDLKTLLKENKIHCYSYWDKKKLLDFVKKHELLSKEAPKKERSKDPKFDRLKTIMHNPRKVSLEGVETIYKAGKFVDHSPQTIVYWDGKVWRNKYKINFQYFYYVYVNIMKLV